VLLSIIGYNIVGDYSVLWFLLLIGMFVKVPVFRVHG